MEKVLWVIIVIMLSYLERHGEGALGDVVIVFSDLERHKKKKKVLWVILSLYYQIWSDMEKSGFLDSSERGLQKVIAEDFALIDEAPYLQYAISQHCGLTTIGKQFSTKSYAFAMPQGSPLTEQVSN